MQTDTESSAAAPAAIPNPARIVTEAIQEVIDRGLAVASNPELGVRYRAAWELDPRAGAVSPLGAVLLVRQPQNDEPTAALVETLGVPWLWAEGFNHGCARARPNPSMQAGLESWVYSEGYGVGAEARLLLHRIDHRIDHLSREIKADPKKLIPALLASLQPSQVLAMLAAAQRERGTTLGGAAKEFHDRAAADLYALAENFLHDGL